MSWIDSVTSYLKKPKLDLGAVKKKARPLLESLGAEFDAQQRMKRDLIKRVGEIRTPLTEEGLFQFLPPTREEKIPLKEFVQKKSYFGGRVGKGIAQTISDVTMGTMPMMGGGVPTLKTWKIGPAIKGAVTGAGLTVVMKKLRGEEVKPKELIAPAAFMGFMGGFVPVKPQSVASTKLGQARKTLGVSPYDSPSKIHAKYRELAMKYHPDRGGSPAKMAEINSAFETLTSNKAPAPTAKWSVFIDWISKFGDWIKKSTKKPTGKELMLPGPGLGTKPPVVPGGRILYHGTTAKSASEISKTGFKVLPPVHGKQVMGEGVYLTPTKEEATTFGEKVVKIRLKPDTKILRLSLPEYSKMFMEIGAKSKNVERDLTKHLQSLGYDGLEVPGFGSKGETYITVFDPDKLVVEEKPPTTKPDIEKLTAEKKLTLKKLEKQETIEKFESFLSSATSSEDYVDKVDILRDQVPKTESKSRLRIIRAAVVKEMYKITGISGTGNYKKDYAFMMASSRNPEIEDAFEALDTLRTELDEKIGVRKPKEEFKVIETDITLPKRGEYYIPYGKYSTAGTKNREWVQQNIPLLRMGNKRGMVGYILNALGIEQKDLGSLSKKDVSHLSHITNVEDLFGGSGLLSNLSKKFFPNAKITYNELSRDTLNAIQKTKDKPEIISKFVSEVALYLSRNPDADWLAHFNTIYKGNKDFFSAAVLIEAAAGRTDITPRKLENLIQAIPNFSDVFQGIKITQEDAIKKLDYYIEKGTDKDFLWIDPPYIWSTGYEHGAKFEKAEGFMELLDKIDQLDKKGVNFIFFNNEPEVQVEKAGPESVYITDIMGKLNALSDDLTIVRGIKPIGAAKRRELLITNLEYGEKAGAFLNLEEVKRTIIALKKDPKTAPREMLKLLRNIRESTDLVEGTEKISAWQIRRIRTLRGRLRVKNRELVPMLDELLGESSFAKMTKEDGERMIEFLQPKNWAEIEEHTMKARKKAMREKVEKVTSEPFVAKNAELEERFGVIEGFNKTAKEVEDIASMIEGLPEFKPKKPTVIGGIAPFMSESVSADLLGIRDTFHSPLRAITNVGRQLTNRMEENLTKVFKDLTKEETKQVIFAQAGMPRAEVKKLSKKVQERAKYLQEVSEAHLKLINNVRKAKGIKPLIGKKPYIPYIINENISMAADLFDKSKFWETRTKTFEDFQAGLFTHDPKRIIKIWSRSAGDYLKKNLFGAFMIDRYQDLNKVSWQASTYGRMMIEMDIYNMSSDTEKLLRSVGGAINARVGSIFPKKIPVNEELAKSIINTTFGKELLANIEKGYLKVPRFQLPNVTDVVHSVFYPAKLAWNFGFGLLNRQQPWAEIPFIGVRHKMEGRLKMYSLLMPWNKIARQRYWDILRDSGYQFGRYVAGEEMAWHNRIINFVSDTTEAMNRLETTVGAEKFLNQAQGKISKELSQADKDKTIAAFSAFINFMAGKGWSPIKQRTTLGRLAYTFQQYPLNQINVYTEMYRQAMKDDGAREFWQRMARDGGASQDAQDFFEKLPDTSKVNIYRIFLALALPVAVIYVLSRSWNVAQRAVPGMPRISFIDLAQAVSDYLEDPEKGKETLTREIKNFFSITAIKRVDDYMKARKYGIIQRGTSKRPMFVEEKDVRGVLTWGRTVLPEYEKQYPGWLSRLMNGEKKTAKEIKDLKRRREKIRSDDTEIAVQFMKEYSRAKTAEEKKALFYDYQNKGFLTESVVRKIESFYKEKALGIGGLERSIKSMNVEDRATYILQEIERQRAKDPAGVANLLVTLRKQGILTPAVIEEMKKKIQGQAPTKTGFKEQLRKLPGGEALFPSNLPMGE